ncbi:MutS-related protein [Capnocytophaga canis]|uniref:MutS-related protein n=1 Tax=Capnocytophaga canis TaxID=1848903 RepID=UPI001561C801|nr:DNA mismatch repair protein [Capnocytophaga canis]
MIPAYKKQLEKAKDLHQKYTKIYNIIGAVRLCVAISILFLGYLSFTNFSLLYLVGIFFFVTFFLFLVVKHKKISYLRKIEKSKIDINQKEIDFLEKGVYFYDNGFDFQDKEHPYAYDLDIFGEKSLFHYINRAVTFSGKKQLAAHFLRTDNKYIPEKQATIAELSEKLEWRQDFMAVASQAPDNQHTAEKISTWKKRKEVLFSFPLRVFIYLSPLLLLSFIILGYIFDYADMKMWANTLFVINLMVFGWELRHILKNKQGFEGIYDTLYSVRKNIELIEKESFKSKQICELQQQLIQNNQRASELTRSLARLLDNMDNVLNIFSWVLNGFTLYHLHQYNKLILWKKINAEHVATWLDVINEMEALCSLANFKYNHPEFVFPELNAYFEVSFVDIGHPLIAENQRVTNSISFKENRFVILTGSNMSGKSTFLRTLGVNVLLTSMGLPVCAKKANVHPMKILISMRLSDSLNDGKSYFFAEIDRLKQIMQTLQQEPCFVLLDELLRGTNSEDKQSGTVKIIEKMVELNAIGIIATHDLEVCKLESEYPHHLKNQCFEVEIINNELHFDYKLKEGVCQNKNATFLMKKMGII